MRRAGQLKLPRVTAKTASKRGQRKKQGAEPLLKHVCTKYAGMILTKACTWCFALGNGVANKLGRPLVLKNTEAHDLVSQKKKPSQS
jgi:hypothetical protein